MDLLPFDESFLKSGQNLVNCVNWPYLYKGVSSPESRRVVVTIPFLSSLRDDDELLRSLVINSNLPPGHFAGNQNSEDSSRTVRC